MATTTTNFGWDIPQSTDLVKDGATAIAALGQDIDTALVDLKGGTTGQLLSKASGTDLDFTWASPASGGGMTLLSTTTLSGAGTTISSISQSYINLEIFIVGVNANTNGQYLQLRPNGAATSSSSNIFDPSSTGASKTYDNINAEAIWLSYNSPLLNNDTNNAFSISITNYASTTAHKAINASSTFVNTSSVRKFANTSGFYNSTSAISSLEFRMIASGTTGNFNGGTVLIYGVK